MEDYVTVEKAAYFYEREGKVYRAIIEGVEVGIAYYEGRFYAFTNRCTHAQFPLHFGKVDEEHSILCWSHGARFNLETGAVMEWPSYREQGYPLPLHDVRVVGEDVQVRLRSASQVETA
jgi:nitrite reductase/ring-hydroxylating ferredoxin subunit